jgi:hypothetical protein
MEKNTTEPAIVTTMAMIVIRDDVLCPALTIIMRHCE